MHSRHCGDTRAPAPRAVLTAEELLFDSLLPLFGAPRALPKCPALDAALPSATSFVFDERESARSMVTQLLQDCPALTASREGFLAAAAETYDALRAAHA
jgi:hypothetical protein